MLEGRIPGYHVERLLDCAYDPKEPERVVLSITCGNSTYHHPEMT
jgi:hypothetical protein